MLHLLVSLKRDLHATKGRGSSPWLFVTIGAILMLLFGASAIVAWNEGQAIVAAKFAGPALLGLGLVLLPRYARGGNYNPAEDPALLAHVDADTRAIAGIPCVHCARNLLGSFEGAECTHCRRVVHNDCMEGHHERCPAAAKPS